MKTKPFLHIPLISLELSWVLDLEEGLDLLSGIGSYIKIKQKSETQND